MKSILLSSVMLLTLTAVQAQELKPLNSDTEPDRMDWSQLDAKFGPFPKLPAGHYLVTLVTKNGEDVGLSVNDGAYVQADGTGGQRSEATGACLSFDVTLWDDGPIVGKLTGDRRITDAIWSDAAGREFFAPASGGDAKSGERKIDYELRLYRASDGPNADSGTSSAASGGKMNPAPSQKRS